MIQAFGLTSDSRKEHPPAVDDISFEARAGRVTVLLGAPGAGKSTALRLMLELQQGRGLTYFRGRPLHRIAHPSREVGVLLGDVPGHPARTVRGHLRMLCAAAGVPVRRADEVLEVVGLISLRDERLGTLSRGMDRRLGLACALLADPHTLVLDDPGQDLSGRENRWLHGMLRAHAAHGGTVLTTTADPKEAALIGDRVVTLERGRLVADQEAADFARTRLRPRVAVRSPYAARLAAFLAREARTGQRSVEVVQEDGNRLSVYGSTCADVGEVAFRNGILIHQLADETGDMGAGAGAEAGVGAGAQGATPERPPGVSADSVEVGGASVAIPAPSSEPGEGVEGVRAERDARGGPSADPKAQPSVVPRSFAVPRPATEPAPPDGPASCDGSDSSDGVPPSGGAAPCENASSAESPYLAERKCPSGGACSSEAVCPEGACPPEEAPTADDTSYSDSGTASAAALTSDNASAPDAASVSDHEPGPELAATTADPDADPDASDGQSSAPEPATVVDEPLTVPSPSTGELLPAERLLLPGPVTAPVGSSAPPPRRPAVPRSSDTLSALSALPPPISVRSAPSPLRPLRYELRRAAGIGTGFLTAAAVLLTSALTAVFLARIGHTPQARLLAGWPGELPLPPTALGAGLLGALAFGDEFRHPALAADRGTVPRRLGLLTAKLLVAGLTGALLAFLTVGCNAEVLYLLYGSELAQVPADWPGLSASWLGLVVGCSWAGVLAAGVFRSTTAGLAAVVAVPVVVVPLAQWATESASVRTAAGFSMRLREVLLVQWPFGGERYLFAAVRVIAQPVGGALALSLAALLCTYLLTTLRSRVR
ncbi:MULTISPECIES: ATP-binding cassette domain-containing protein [Streptomyces]|uniref:ATP-binding cassette domain-containing protein n=2 Tax=Streptomyces TaxID=1883 RepID=A0ABV9IUA0_9ACTN